MAYKVAGGGAFLRFLTHAQRIFVHKAETVLPQPRDGTSTLGLRLGEERWSYSHASRPAVEAGRSENPLPGVFALSLCLFFPWLERDGKGREYKKDLKQSLVLLRGQASSLAFPGLAYFSSMLPGRLNV